MGFSDIGCYGGEIRTPNLDALAADQGLPGPCLVEGEFATLAVPPGWTFTVERNGWMNLRA